MPRARGRAAGARAARGSRPSASRSTSSEVEPVADAEPVEARLDERARLRGIGGRVRRRGRRRPRRGRASRTPCSRRDAARARPSSRRCRAGSRAGSACGSETSARAPSRSGVRTSPTAPGGRPARSSAGPQHLVDEHRHGARAPRRRCAGRRRSGSSAAARRRRRATFGRASKFAPTTPIGIRRAETRSPFVERPALDLALERRRGGHRLRAARRAPRRGRRRAGGGRAPPRRAGPPPPRCPRVRLGDLCRPRVDEPRRRRERLGDRSSVNATTAACAAEASRSIDSRRPMSWLAACGKTPGGASRKRRGPPSTLAEWCDG